MIKKIDVESDEFKVEFEKTKFFTKSVLDKYDLVYNPNEEINKTIQIGLTRNSLIYGKRYCPCFMVEKETKKNKNRLCPCIPALTNEIPNNGACHCGIFCTQEKAYDILNDSKSNEEKLESKIEETKENDLKKIFSKADISSEELQMLLESRQKGKVDFILVDTREWNEWINDRIIGTDYLVPTTSFFDSIKALDEYKNIPIIVYCRSGTRSAHCRDIMIKTLNFTSVSNLEYGIIYFNGKKERGEA